MPSSDNINTIINTGDMDNEDIIPDEYYEDTYQPDFDTPNIGCSSMHHNDFSRTFINTPDKFYDDRE